MSLLPSSGSTERLQAREYLENLKQALASLDTSQLDAVALQLLVADESGGTVYVAGNGGSAANASHCAVHLREAGIRAICLTDSVIELTAKSNDFSYADAWSIAAPLRNEDVVIVFSGSGESENINRLLGSAYAVDALTVAFLGMTGGNSGNLAHMKLVVASDQYGPIEDVHSAICHLLKDSLLAQAL
jgi:D-sedoheptulose 7-phosphate isomerase